MIDTNWGIYMIDTNKYKGHTKGHWTWMGEEVFVDEGPTIARITSDILTFQADANLIADAPKLLAEVKRLRDGIERAIYDFSIDNENLNQYLKELIE